MSLPSFSDKDDALTREEVVNQIISSIAMEELGLSHIINAEGEKLQYALGTIPDVPGPKEPVTMEELLKLNDSVRKTLDSTMMNQFFLKEKLFSALSASVMQGPQGPPGPQGPATITIDPEVDNLEPGESPYVRNDEGTLEDVILKFGIPRGATGDPGETPHIDTSSGNWFIGNVDTGVSARGPQGDPGESPHIDSITGNWFIGDVDTGIPARGPQGEPGGTPTFSVENVETLDPGETATVEVDEDSQSPNNWLFSFGIPKGEKGDTGSSITSKIYRTNLNSTNTPFDIPLKELTLQITYVSTGNLDAFLIPSRPILVDVRRVGIWGMLGVEGTNTEFNNFTMTTRTRIDNNFYSRSDEKWFAWIRQQDQNGLWTLHEVHIFSSANGARTTIWVNLIEENIDYDNPDNPKD